jgi:hypothetical protein
MTRVPNAWPERYRELVEHRIELINRNRDIGLIERPEYKRRWHTQGWQAREHGAKRRWLLDRLEQPGYWPQPRLTTCARLAEAARLDADFMQVAELYAGADFDLTRIVVDLVKDESVPYLASYRLKESGLRKRSEWERTWDLQRAEDEIDALTAVPVEQTLYLTPDQAAALKGREVGKIPVPPKYSSADFVKASYWRHRGELDVPQERFVSYPGVERENDATPVVGWAGWDHLQRAQALAAWYTEARDRGTDRDRLVPILAGLWELIPWLRQWHNDVDPTYGERLGDFFASFTMQQAAAIGRTPHDLAEWRPPAVARRRRRVVNTVN